MTQVRDLIFKKIAREGEVAQLHILGLHDFSVKELTDISGQLNVIVKNLQTQSAMITYELSKKMVNEKNNIKHA